jgi:hypothetical protein
MSRDAFFWSMLKEMSTDQPLPDKDEEDED